jgi:hypothetical protein
VQEATVSDPASKLAAELAAAKTFGRRDVATSEGKRPTEALLIADGLLTIAKRVAEMTVDQRADLERACRALGVTAPRLLTATPRNTVHFLRGGNAICGRMGQLIPTAWPAGNDWTADHTRVTCQPCLERFRALRTTR